MKEYVKAIFPAEFKHNVAYWRGFVLGLVMLLLAVAQLFQFEDFPALINDMHVPGGMAVAWVLAAYLPFAEIASLPFLLSMKVTAKVRTVSKWLGVSVCVVWLLLTLWTSITMGTAVQSGIFGATLTTNSGWWSVLFAFLLGWSYWLTMRELPKRRER